jgi:hypothetical protein
VGVHVGGALFAFRASWHSYNRMLIGKLCKDPQLCSAFWG